MAEIKEDRFKSLAEAASKQVFESSFPSLNRMLKTVDDAIQENLSASANVEKAMDEFEAGLDNMNSQLSAITEYMRKTVSLLKKVSEIIDKNSGKSFLESLFSAKGVDPKAAAAVNPKSSLVAPAAALGGGAILGGALASNLGEKDNNKKPVENGTAAPGNLLNLPTEEKNKLAQNNDAQKAPMDVKPVDNKIAQLPDNNQNQSKNSSSPAPIQLSQNESNVFKNLKPNYDVKDLNKDATPLADLPSANAREVAFRPEDQNKTSESIDALRESKETKYKASIIEFLAGSIVFNDKSKGGGFSFDSLNTEKSSGAGSSITTAGAGGGGSAGGADGSKGDEKDEEKSNPKLAQVSTASGKKANVAKEYADKFQGFIKDLEGTGYKINDLGGYSFRKNVNNPSKMSMHSYGAAIDINAANNPNGTTKTDLPPETNEIAKKWGLGWGMNWKSVKDPMHFSAASEEGGSQAMGEPIKSTKSSSVAEAPAPEQTQSSAGKPIEAPSASIGPQIQKSSVAASDSSTSAPPTTTTVNNVEAPIKGGPEQNPKLADSRIAGPVEPEDSSSRYSILFDMSGGSSLPAAMNR